MRSILFTLFLGICAALIFGVIGWQMREGNLNAVFGVPPVQPGQRLYTHFQPSEVARIRVAAHGINEDFIKTEDGWKSQNPPNDRMDPQANYAIIAFTLNLNVQDFAPTDEIDRDEAGLRSDSIQITLETASGTQLANYRIGDRTPLLSENKDAPPDSTVYIQVRERGRKDFIYACTGDISGVFRDGLKYLRDHRPLYFNPQNLQKIRLRSSQGELTLNQAITPQGSVWRIAKPLELRVNKAAVVSLVKGLVDLTAVRIADRSSVTLPSAETTAKTVQIGLTNFGTETETLLEIYPPESADATEVLATVSNRPNTVFYLPVKPKPGSTSLSDLPVSVNDLRDRSIANIDVSKLQAITISPATGTPIHITRGQVEIDGITQPPNLQRFDDLLKALSGHAIGFESDSATDFTPWGLHRPFLVIDIMGENNQGIRLNFGMDGRGAVFVNRQGTPTVMQVKPDLLKSIAIRPYEWKQSLLWSISTVDLVAIERIVKMEAPLVLFYEDNEEKWTGQIDQQDVTDHLDPAKAKRLLDALADLNVTRWLAADDADAATALATPYYKITVVERTINDVGDAIGIEGREVNFAPVPGDSQMFYGRLNGDQNPFLLDRAAFLKIAIDPMEKR